ncbi:hypothetical protein L2W58_09250 [Dethiosulfovibrio sp. F2B]|uniref:hypothetical protein n=1 Tax=Dethiosulfovibrio faecalis TaxID=2720018 RepID=UPI001F3900A7|nr:hypothetical protein [Dethiosulfovibrio faecalis]MCF4151983.1 hypothetical protein [Dethiosulfovibrio faecalis]
MLSLRSSLSRLGRKRSWFLFGLTLLGLTVFLVFGALWAVPSRVMHPIEAIPRVSDRIPHMVFAGEGDVFYDSSIGKLGLDLILEMDETETIGHLSELFRSSDRTACCILYPIDDDPFGCFAFRLDRACCKDFDEGKLTEVAKRSFVGVSVTPFLEENHRGLILEGGELEKPLFCSLYEGLFVLSSSRKGFRSMLEAIDGRMESFYSAWDVEPFWPGHLEVSGGEGAFWPGSNLTVMCSWRSDDDGGVLRWRIEGADDVLPDLEPFEWKDLPDLPFPLGMAVGAILPEPVIVASGGETTLLSAPFPGGLVHFLRNNTGDGIVQSLWRDVFFDFLSMDVSGDSGVIALSPFPVVAFNEEERGSIGLLDPDSLRSFHSVDMDDRLIDPWRNSVAWGYMNGPSFALFLEGMIKSGRILFPEDVESSMGMDSLVNLTRYLRSLCDISFVVTEIDEGILRWTCF